MRRPTCIVQTGFAGEFLLAFAYVYPHSDLVETMERCAPECGLQDTTSFTYDRRRRLIHEVRERFNGSGVSLGEDFDLAYAYDGGRNRTRKINPVPSIGVPRLLPRPRPRNILTTAERYLT